MKSTDRNTKTPRSTTQTFVALGGLLGAGGRGAPAGGSGFRKPLTAALLSLCALAVALVAAAPASAVNGHVFSSSFGSPGSGAGQVNLTPIFQGDGYTTAGSGVAVNDETHDVYVADTGNRRVDEFEADGKFIRAWGWGVADGVSEKLQVCTVTCFAGLSGTGPGEFDKPVFIAVDNSAGPSNGDVYVGNTVAVVSGETEIHNRVVKFSGSGALIESWGTHGYLAGLPGSEYTFGQLDGIAVGSGGTGTLYVNPNSNTVYEFEQDGTFDTELKTTRGNTPLGLGVDPEGNVFKVNGSREVEEFGSLGTDIGQLSNGESASALATGSTAEGLYLDEGGEIAHYAFSALGVVSEIGPSCTVEPYTGCAATDTFGSGSLSESTGVAVDTSDSKVYAAEPKSDKIEVFAPAVLPGVLSEAASNVAPATATLNGSVNPAATPTTYQFQYGTGTAYGSLSPASPGTVGSDSATHALTASVTGLAPDTVYHYRIAATNANGTSFGRDRSFETTGPPTLSAVESERVSGLTHTSATLAARVHPHGFATRYWLEYGTSGNFGSSTPAGEVEAEAGFRRVEVSLTGLTLGTTYHYRFVASNEAAGKTNLAYGPDETFTTIAAAPIEGESVVNVASSEAKLTAKIDAFGEATSYRLEYGPSEAYGTSTPEHSAGAGGEPAPVFTQLTGLRPGTEYHYRYVATNATGTTLGPDASFTTLAATTVTAGLPDGRAYELVSGAGEPGEVYIPGAEPATEVHRPGRAISTQPFLAAAGGNAVAYVGDPTETGGSGNVGNGQGNELLATRDPSRHRWDVSDIAPPYEPEGGAVEKSFYEGFSSDLSAGVLAEPLAQGLASIGPEGPAGCSVLYARSDAGYRALFTETQSPKVCGKPLEAGNGAPPQQSLQFAGANTGAPGVAEWSELLFQTPAALTPGTAAAAPGEGDNLYESYEGVTRPVNVLPGATQADPNATFGGPSGETYQQADFGNVISADGSRVFWTDLSTHGLYARENPLSPAARTVQLDVGQEGATGQSGGGLFWAASSDGSKVLFTDCRRLTSDATAIAEHGCDHRSMEDASDTPRTHRLLSGNDLYLYDFSAPEGHRLTDLTVDGHEADPLRADVQGVVGAGEDGSYVYFVAGGALAAGAEHRDCREPREELTEKGIREENTSAAEADRLGAEQAEEELGHLPPGRGCNLYLEHVGEAPRLIAVLAAKDDHLTASEGKTRMGDWMGELGGRTAEATPDGRQLVFQSTQPLTGYDNTPIVQETGNPERASEVFVYDASTERLVCASCDPRGAPPSAEYRGSGTHLPRSIIATSIPRWISADGSRVFFDSSQPLVPQDTNGLQDVYEWEREGTAGCPTANSDWGGCVALLSGGTSSENSYLIDADEAGDNVFFTYVGSLPGIVTAVGKVNVIDARVDGGFPQPTLACTGTGCQGVPPASPAFSTPAGATFAGVGNFPPVAPGPAKKSRSKKAAKCRRGLVKRRSKCVRSKRRSRTVKKPTKGRK